LSENVVNAIRIIIIIIFVFGILVFDLHYFEEFVISGIEPRMMKRLPGGRSLIRENFEHWKKEIREELGLLNFDSVFLIH
jgi:hypothetical protein